ncbi:hydroxymethylbilane synthase|uniref:Porphobilinogen deaminase n=1 Tax=Dendrosporobacter quercicolus TaxID=146817 RepID=A0A1G9TLL0_9FIRM|nr:hydroxymethylbilane synthase [Dendrosporobacter quercicolus]NSL48921.1 hydroxymethylbilane synthase [Dendrosporobacter quercicolus DSM 1736]SDM48583.1 hydroxymethylbilane synthase [Dendrosporobacter quercicolus]
MKEKLVIGTRGSKLALWQAHYIADCLRSRYAGLEVSLQRVVTTGDKILDVPLARIGGKGLFTKELETSMLAGEIDLAVHSMKDMPTELPEGLILAAVTERTDAGDALISPQYKSVEALPPGARVGTSSLRRKAQLLHYRPDLIISDLRGNLDTRLNKLETEQLDAIVLAVAGLKRLGWQDRITQILPTRLCLPAVGQGALAIETRSGDHTVRVMLEFLDDAKTRAAVTAERAFLREVEGGCQVPVGVYGTVEQQAVRVEAVILTVDGTTAVRDSICGDERQAAALGQALAKRMLDAGGREIMAGLAGVS